MYLLVDIVTLWFHEKNCVANHFCFCWYLFADFSVKSSWEVHWIVMFQKDAVCKINSLHRREEYGKIIWIYLKFYTSLRCLVFFPAASTSMMHGASYIVHYTIKPIYRQRQFCPSRPMTLDDFSSFYSSTIKARSLETNTIKSKAL